MGADIYPAPKPHPPPDHVIAKHSWGQLGSQLSPGVLLDWRQRQGMWEAYVTYATGGGNVDVTVTTQWVPAIHVRPVE